MLRYYEVASKDIRNPLDWGFRSLSIFNKPDYLGKSGISPDFGSPEIKSSCFI